MERFEAEQFVAFLDKIEKLKSVPRHCVTSDGTQEYVAGHCWRTAMMAYLMKDELGEIDIDKVIRMCLWHDIGEAVTGDIPTFLKNESHEETEKNEVDKLLSELPKPLYEEVSALFAEMEAQETKEAKVYKALDKLEAVIQHNESDISTWLPLEYELQQTYAAQNVVGFPFLESLQEQAVKRTKEKIAEQEAKAAGGNAQEAAAAIAPQAVGETATAVGVQAAAEAESAVNAQAAGEAEAVAGVQADEEAESAVDAQAAGKPAEAADTQAGGPSGESKEPESADKSLGEAAGGIEVKSGMTKRQLRREEKETQKRLAREEKDRQKRLAQEEKEAQKRREQEEKQRSRQEKRDARAVAREERRKECKALWHVAELAILITFVVLAIDQSGVYGFLGVWLFIALMVASVVALLYGILCAVRKKRCGIIFFVAITGIILCTAWFVFLIFGQGLGGPVPN